LTDDIKESSEKGKRHAETPQRVNDYTSGIAREGGRVLHAEPQKKEESWVENRWGRTKPRSVGKEDPERYQ